MFDDVYIWQQDSFTFSLFRIQKKVRKLPPGLRLGFVLLSSLSSLREKQKHPNMAERGGDSCRTSWGAV